MVRLELRALIGAGGARPRNFSFRLTRQAHSEELLLCLLANTLIMARHPRGTRLLEGVQGTWIAHSIAFFRFDTCKSALELVETLPSIRYALAPHFIDFEGENVGFVAGGSGPTPLTIGGSAIGTEDVPLDPPIELTDDELDSIEYLRLQHAVTVSPVRPMWTNSVPLLGAFGDRFEVVGGIDDFHFDVNSPFFVEGGQRSYLVSRRVKSKGDKPKYQFETFYHPYCCAMLERLNRSGLDALLNAPASDFVLHRQLHKEGNPLIPSGRPRFATFSPTDRVWRNTNDPYYPHPYEHFDFSRDGAYSIYNWELFFHIPLLVADRLTKENRFELAHRWYQYTSIPLMYPFIPNRPSTGR